MNFERLDKDLFDKAVIGFRRELHKYPETGWTEYRTTLRIMEELKKLKIPFWYGKKIHSRKNRMGLPDMETDQACLLRAIDEIGHEKVISEMAGGYTGVIGMIEGTMPGPTTAIRFDIDCNDVDEDNSQNHKPVIVGFASTHKNLMHACGHDAHAAIGVGTAMILSKYRDKLKGCVMLIFQPAEEGGRGAMSIVDSGILKNVNYIFAGHVAPGGIPFGYFSAHITDGSISKKADLIFKGIPSHAGAMPEMGKNALAAAATAALNILGISRHHQGYSRVNVGVLNAGTGRNVIPDSAVIMAEVRGQTNEINDYMFNRMLEIGQGAASMHDCKFSYKMMGSTIDAPCDEDLVALIEGVAKETEGVKKVLPGMSSGGSGEDFSFLARDVQSRGGKSTYLWLGASVTAPQHNSSFDMDERVISLSAELFTKIVFALAEKPL